MAHSKISVIIPVFNVEKYLEKCLISIVDQTYSNLEIIIINDGSTDASSEVCKKFAKQDSRVLLINQKNQGLSVARNTGIRQSRGDFLVFVDGDDWVDKTFIEELYIVINKKFPSIAVCGYQEVAEDHSVISSAIPKTQTIVGQQALANLLTQQKDLDVITWNKIYSRELFIKNNITFPVKQIHEDNLTTYKLYSCAKTVAYIDKPLYYYVQRPNSITAKSANINKATYKERAATEAIAWLKEYSPTAVPAAEIALLYAKFTYLDSSQQVKPTMAWIKSNKTSILQNPLLTKKLRLYLFLLKFGYAPYKILKILVGA